MSKKKQNSDRNKIKRFNETIQSLSEEYNQLTQEIVQLKDILSVTHGITFDDNTTHNKNKSEFNTKFWLFN